MDKKELTLQVIERLKKEYPEAKCTLDYDKAWQLLVSVRLAAQCTDARVDQITPLLYEKSGDEGDREDRAALRAWTQQSAGHLRLYEGPARKVQ